MGEGEGGAISVQSVLKPKNKMQLQSNGSRDISLGTLEVNDSSANTFICFSAISRSRR